MHYKIGDILLTKSIPRSNTKWYHKLFTRLQNIFDGKASHSEIIVGYDAKNNIVTTFGSNGDGVKYREFDLGRKDVAVVRLKEGINQKKAKYILEILERKYLNTPYSYPGLINASINTVLEYFFPKSWHKKTIIKEEYPVFCSELVGEFIELCCQKRLSVKNEKNIHNNQLTPSDIYESYDIVIVKDFG